MKTCNLLNMHVSVTMCKMVLSLIILNTENVLDVFVSIIFLLVKYFFILLKHYILVPHYGNFLSLGIFSTVDSIYIISVYLDKLSSLVNHLFVSQCS